MKKILISAMALSMLAGAAGAASAGDFYHDVHDGPGFADARWDHGHDHRGWRDRSDWRRGGYVGRGDWNRGRVVDYRMHHLRRPPRGYEWRQVDGRYVMAAIATGVIADIIINSR